MCWFAGEKKNSFVLSRHNGYKCVLLVSIHKTFSYIVLTVILTIRIICLHVHFFYRKLLDFFLFYTTKKSISGN
jgi:hypothetical protein